MENFIRISEIVNDITQTSENVYECLNCGALVLCKSNHTGWHQDQDRIITEIVRGLNGTG